jgi:hypothetical protein
MRARLIFATLGLAAFAACGGGGGGGGGGVGMAPTPTNTDERPAESGDTFAYAGTTTMVFVRPPQSNGAIPSPNPENTQTLTYATTQSQSVATSEVFNGIAGAVAFETLETDTLAGGLTTTTSNSTEYYSFLPSGSSTLIRDLGGTETTSTGTSISTVLGPNNGLIDVLPETPGTIAPANDARAVRTETDADGSTSIRTTASDGTYTEDDTFIDGTNANAVANADGSGTYAFPVGEPTDAIFAVGAPTGSGSSATIPITITYPAGLIVTPGASPTPTVVTRSVTPWYPVPIVASSASLVDIKGAPPDTFGVACPQASNMDHEIVASATSVDPVFGELDTRSTSTYTAPGFGVICVEFSDDLEQFYDFSQQTGQYVATRSTPVQTTTTTQLLGLTNENVIGLSNIARVRAIAASRARFNAMLETRRTERHARALRALRDSARMMAGVR